MDIYSKKSNWTGTISHLNLRHAQDKLGIKTERHESHDVGNILVILVSDEDFWRLYQKELIETDDPKLSIYDEGWMVEGIIDSKYVWDSGGNDCLVKTKNGCYFMGWGLDCTDSVWNSNYTVYGPYSELEKAKKEFKES